jgi:hypothetical protein
MTAFLLTEISLRLFVPDTRSPYIYDEFTGTRLNPGQRYVFLSEGYSNNVINSQGLRDREHSLDKPPGTYRIVILGDSFCEAFQVPQRNAFWSVLERELQQRPQFRDRTVEVINFGVSGFGTIQEWQMLRHYASRYSPDLVLLAFLPGNDVRNNSPQLETDRRRPYATLVDGELQLDVTFRDDPAQKRFRELTWIAFKDQVIRRSRVVYLLYRAKEDWLASRAARAERPQQRSADVKNESASDDELEAAAEESGIDSQVYAPPKSDSWRDAWDITDRVLGAINDDSRAMGAKFVLVILNNSVEVHPDPEVTLSLARQLGVPDLEEPQRRLVESAERHGFPVIRLLERMREIARRDKVCFHGFENTSPCTGHWNEKGHETAGKLIAADLVERLTEDDPQ